LDNRTSHVTCDFRYVVKSGLDLLAARLFTDDPLQTFISRRSLRFPAHAKNITSTGEPRNLKRLRR